MITSYQKGVELVNRLLIIFLCLKYEIRKEQYSPRELLSLSLYRKTQRYQEIFEDEYLFIINLIDRNLRNSESHLDLRYSRKLNKINYIVRQKKGTRVFRLPIDRFILGYHPNPGYVIQGYLFSIMLFLTIGEMYSLDIKKIIKKL